MGSILKIIFKWAYALDKIFSDEFEPFATLFKFLDNYRIKRGTWSSDNRLDIQLFRNQQIKKWQTNPTQSA